MPGREKGFYEAWRALAMNEWSTCGIRNSNNKIRALSIDPVATVLEKLNTFVFQRNIGKIIFLVISRVCMDGLALLIGDQKITNMNGKRYIP